MKKPKKNPAYTAMKKSPRPKRNPMYDMMSPQSVEGRSTRAMKDGGKCRGMGAATKGGRYSKAG